MSQTWDYVLETDDDDFSFISTGQIRLNDDGTVEQRVFLSIPKEYNEWSSAVGWMWPEDVRYDSAEAVEEHASSGYTLTRVEDE